MPSPATRSPNPSSDITPRLLTVEEGCGFSNATHKRIVGGDPAKPGKLKHLFWRLNYVLILIDETFQVLGHGWHYLAIQIIWES